ncbi:PorT family protein [Antarcticibacterium sp. 1MA-6-2]|nr:PorT family protein [Antarcticibacterium sp. 1MA-6-2]UJH91730.1 PorT family protein [Antarcticibacterium sp. 1MA-6-2]
MNFSKGSPPPESAVNTNWQPGITAGFLMLVPLTGNFSVQPEYLFSQMGGKVADEN